MKRCFILFLSLLVLSSSLISGCSVVQGLSSMTIQSTPAPTPSGGKGTVTGRVISTEDGKPVAGQYVFLAVVNYNNAGNGAFFLDTTRSPGAQADDNGNFIFLNVTPGDYVFVVGEPVGGETNVVIDNATGKPKIWKIEANKILKMGELKVSLH